MQFLGHYVSGRIFFFFWGGGGGGRVAQSVERATPGEEVLGSIPAATARSLLVRSKSA